MRVPIRPVLLVSLLIATALGWGAAPVAAAQTWAPAKSATIHPGVQLFTKDAQCTANFIYYDASGAIYVGQAAHCAGVYSEPPGVASSMLRLTSRLDAFWVSGPSRSIKAPMGNCAKA